MPLSPALPACPPHLGAASASLVLAGLLALTALSSACTTTASPVIEQRARDATSALLAEHAELWSAGELDAFVAGYAEDCVFISPSGVTRGRAEVAARYRARYPDKAAMGTLTLEPIDQRVAVDAIGRGIVSVSARWGLAYPDKEPLAGLTLVVFEGGPEGWLIVQDASM